MNALFRQFAALGLYACPASSLTPTLAPTATTASVNNPSAFYPYVPTKPSGPLTPYPPTTGDNPPPSFGGDGVTNGGIKESGMKGLAAATSLVVVCFVVFGAVGVLL